MEAFLFLDGRREVSIGGMGGVLVGYLRVSEIEAYVRLNGWADDRRRCRELLYYLSVLDAAAVEHHQARASPPKKAI